MAMFLFLHKWKFFHVFLNLAFMFMVLCILLHLDSSSNSAFLNNSITQGKNSSINAYKISMEEDISCKGIHRYNDRLGKCLYVKSHQGCQPKGYICYLQLFYCTFSPSLGYSLLSIWLVLLFYLLGDTSSRYFCTSLEGLSRVMKLSPTIAGVTLLSLGNGAPDVLATVISFMGDGDTKDIGLNSILGGVFFVSSVVVGVISICIDHQGRKVSSSSFIGNSLFLLACLCCLLVFIIVGKINLWGALCFLCLYFIYVAFIFTSELLEKREKESENWCLPVSTPLLVCNDSVNDCDSEVPKQNGTITCIFHDFWYVLELPLDLPRKLTIPIICQERWSRPIAMVSAALAPVLLSTIWNLHYQKSWLVFLPIVASVAILLALILFCTSDKNNPPKKYTFIWLTEAFFLSITWTYILAQELISLLVSIGIILGISHSFMGLTILAWGNSLGDLVSNLTMAKNGGPGGAQTAISGCFAGPIFNIIIGLGISLAISCWSVYPSSYVIVKDHSLYETFGFLMVGLLWSLVVLTRRKMRLDKLLGIGLVAIYFCFLVLKMAENVGLVVVDEKGDKAKGTGNYINI
ncbi:OLC1v1035338C1 [Oldenlandia corymbosa var. corymbosa]|uniref:OLC1v1035338C1 n=1 Tax=Oldenlandia corymbosa var. corymbosa TaxID=529605 RepID=A0AAV1CVV5_OLDCO|nr:OLC1v1035338C1 [Oldenlandia corymbosa var. corymbosa]